MPDTHRGATCLISNPNLCMAPPPAEKMCRTTPNYSFPTGLAPYTPLPPTSNLATWHADTNGNRDVLVMHEREFRQFARAHNDGKQLDVDHVLDKSHEVSGHAGEILTAVHSFMSKTFREVALERITLKVYKGERYIILKGRPGLRNILKGTRYKAENTKLVDLAVGEVNVVKKFKGDIHGTVLTVVLVGAIDALDAYLTDDETKKKDLGYAIAVDVASTVVASLAGAAVAVGVVLAATALGITMVGAAPLVIATVGAFFIGKYLDSHIPTWKIAHLLHGWVDKQLAKAYHLLVRTGQVIRETAHIWQEIARDTASNVRHLYQRTEWALLRWFNPYPLIGSH